MSGEKKGNERQAARLLLKALRGLSGPEQDTVVEHLLARALGAEADIPSMLVPPAGGPGGTGRARQPAAEMRAPGIHVPGMTAPWGVMGNPRDLEVVDLLVQGLAPADVAARLGIAEDAVAKHARSFSRIASSVSSLGRWDLSILARFGEGRSLPQVAADLGLAEETVASHAREIVERVRRSGWHEAWARTRSGVSVTGGTQQMLPVRLGEEQHRRLKEWCEEHGFSMAVVIRGLVERFLDDQARRAS